MMNVRKIRIFESDNAYSLEKQLNKWFEDETIRIESIGYSTRKDAYSALVYYRYLPPAMADKYTTEPLEEQGESNVKSI